jgi:hypothetical protein
MSLPPSFILFLGKSALASPARHAWLLTLVCKTKVPDGVSMCRSAQGSVPLHWWHLGVPSRGGGHSVDLRAAVAAPAAAQAAGWIPLQTHVHHPKPRPLARLCLPCRCLVDVLSAVGARRLELHRLLTHKPGPRSASEVGSNHSIGLHALMPQQLARHGSASLSCDFLPTKALTHGMLCWHCTGSQNWLNSLPDNRARDNVGEQH